MSLSRRREVFIGYILAAVVIVSNLPAILILLKPNAPADISQYLLPSSWPLFVLLCAAFYFIVVETDHPQLIRQWIQQSRFLRLQARLAYISLYFLAIVLSGLFEALPHDVAPAVAIIMCAWEAFMFAYATWQIFARGAK